MGGILSLSHFSVLREIYLLMVSVFWERFICWWFQCAERDISVDGFSLLLSCLFLYLPFSSLLAFSSERVHSRAEHNSSMWKHDNYTRSSTVKHYIKELVNTPLPGFENTFSSSSSSFMMQTPQLFPHIHSFTWYWIHIRQHGVSYSSIISTIVTMYHFNFSRKWHHPLPLFLIN